ncbi:MAG: hypothetical protein AAB539_04275 [Patescibacteria group bacterium]
MFISLLLVLGAIFGGLFAMSRTIGVPAIYGTAMTPLARPHVYGRPERSIEEIRITAFYFVAKNKKDRIADNWRDALEKNLAALADFHALQLRGRSHISYRIYPAPVIGLEDNIFYDTDVTQRGNPHGLIHISEELDRRALRETGNLYDVGFAARPKNSYASLFILYEGVGASGGIIYESGEKSVEGIAAETGLSPDVIFIVGVKNADGFFLLNREFLMGSYADIGGSLLAHEFYHTLGLPDGYTGTEATPTTSDIMGLGRMRPIERAYIGRETLENLGL